MYRERSGGGGSKAKMERSSTLTSSKGGGGLNLNGKDVIKDRSSPGNSKLSSVSRSSYPNRKPSKGEENVVEESETDSEESDVSGSDGEDTSWISWFCSLRGNEFFCEVDENYIQDDFNLCGLSSQVPYYDYALDLILDVESSHGDMFSEEQNEIIESAAEMLYGLIHVRYILTTKGLGAMLEKYKNAEFGRCPRVYCCGQPCLPVGQSDVSRQSNVKIFCPKCEDIYTPQSRFQDSILFGYISSYILFYAFGKYSFGLRKQILKPTRTIENKCASIVVYKFSRSLKGYFRYWIKVITKLALTASRPGWSLFRVDISSLVLDDLWTPEATKDITGVRSSSLRLQGPQAVMTSWVDPRCAFESSCFDLISPC